jgi:stearoyl-CoA desaturase (delta-9 desaturase)
VAVRTVVVFHATWFVNSASHTWGYQNYTETNDDSTNLWWVALLSFGEGWHNNHHRHPRSAAHGLRRFELDPTWWTIQGLARLGLAYDIHYPPAEKLPG